VHESSFSQFDFHSSLLTINSWFLSWSRASFSQFDFHSSLLAISSWFLSWSSSACANVLQVWHDLVSEIEKSSNLCGSNFLLKFYYKQKKCIAWCLVLAFWCPFAN
jgi:hypothetical protein